MSNLHDALVKHAYDPEDAEHNYKLAIEYERLGQTASAISYYLRAAERADTDELSYECMLKVGMLFDNQSNRFYTVETALKQAINLLPNRPEAYAYLSKFYRYFNKFVDGYTYANLALTMCDFDVKPLRGDCEYDGEYSLIYEKAFCGWWIGKYEECRELLALLRDEYAYDLNEYYYNSVQHSIRHMNEAPSVTYNKSERNKLRYQFKNIERVDRNYSDIMQDMFVLSVLDGKLNGTYLEIGSGEPKKANNTYLLESKFGWKGVGVEYLKELTDKYSKERKNKVILANALNLDYYDILNELADENKTIDYLQLDVEPSKSTYEVLTKIPIGDFKFKVITYEHDHYADLEGIYRQKSRDYLISNGYRLLVTDMSIDGKNSFEDWYVLESDYDLGVNICMKDTSDAVKSPKEYFFDRSRSYAISNDEIIKKQCVCHWCVKVQWPLLHKIDDETYWFEIPKNACTTIKNVLGENWVDKSEYSKLAQDGIIPIVVYKDPVERFVSNLDNYFNGESKRTPFGVSFFRDILQKDMLSMTPQERVDAIFDNLDCLWAISQHHHFYPQTRYIDTKAFKEIRVIPIQNVNNWLQKKKHDNKTTKTITMDMLKPEHIDTIRDLYKEDYDFFHISGE